MEVPMPVSGVVIRCNPEHSRKLAHTLPIPGVLEVSQVLDDGALVAVIETSSVDEEVDAVKTIMAAEGVLDVRIAYHNFEDLVDPT
jgi:nitrate reductase NapAB chaperone NapD